jgi:hypothetical protein
VLYSILLIRNALQCRLLVLRYRCHLISTDGTGSGHTDKQSPPEIDYTRQCAVTHRYYMRANDYCFRHARYSHPQASLNIDILTPYAETGVKRATRRPHVAPQFILRGPNNELDSNYKTWPGSGRMLFLVKGIKSVVKGHKAKR